MTAWKAKLYDVRCFWGETESEWITFLVIHAMRNKGLL